MVADAPVEPAPPGPAAGGLTGPGGGAVRRAGGRLPRRGSGLRAGAGGGRLPVPEPRRTWRRTWSAIVLEGQSARLSAAALETLAIVAYKQPVSRAQIAAIRGVNADGVIRTLHARGFIAEVGRDPGPGQAVLYGTTRLLLERLGWTGSRSCRRSPSSFPGRRSWRPWSTASAPTRRRPPALSQSGRAARPSRDRSWRVRIPGRTTAEGPGSARARQPTGLRGAHRGRAGERQRGGGRPGPAGRTRPRTGSASTGCPSRSGPGWSTTCSTSRPAWSAPPPTRRDGRRSSTLVPAEPRGLSGRPPGRRQRRPAAAHQRRGAHSPLDASALRSGKGVPGRGRGRSHGGRAAPAAGGGGPGGRPHLAGTRGAVGPNALRITIHEGRKRQVRRMCDGHRPPGASIGAHPDRADPAGKSGARGMAAADPDRGPCPRAGRRRESDDPPAGRAKPSPRLVCRPCPSDAHDPLR